MVMAAFQKSLLRVFWQLRLKRGSKCSKEMEEN